MLWLSNLRWLENPEEEREGKFLIKKTASREANVG